MKNRFTLTFIIVLCAICVGKAQDTTTQNRFINLGIGASNWGVPIYGGFEFPVGKKEKRKDQTIAIGASYQSKSESLYYSYYRGEIKWKHTIIGISASYNYYFDRLLDLPSDFDFYGGLGIGYYYWKTTLTGSYNGFYDSYNGTGSGGIGISYVAGGRYYLNDRLALSVHYGGNTILSSGRVGISFKF